MKRSSRQAAFAFAAAERPRRRAPSGVAHRRRPFVDARHPVHVTLRARAGVPSFRSELVARIARRVFAELTDGPRASGRFQVVHHSLQADHVHLLVEATDRASLSTGLRSLAIRLAKRINRSVRRVRRGKVWSGRYHRRDLAGPTEARRALVYVLRNGTKHGHVAPGDVDPFSSADRFTGWEGARTSRRDGVAPWTWLLAVGWTRGSPRGLLRAGEQPARG